MKRYATSAAIFLLLTWRFGLLWAVAVTALAYAVMGLLGRFLPTGEPPPSGEDPKRP